MEKEESSESPEQENKHNSPSTTVSIPKGDASDWEESEEHTLTPNVKYTGGKPFKSTLDEPIQPANIGKISASSPSVWDQHKAELRELFETLVANGIKVRRDFNGIPLMDEALINSLPQDQLPNSGAKEFAPISGVPVLPDGTRVSPRLVMRFLTPAIETELIADLKQEGISVPLQDGQPKFSPEFVSTLPPNKLTSALKPLYDNLGMLSETRKAVMETLSSEKKKALKSMMETKGISLKVDSDGAPIIPIMTLMQFTSGEIADVIGDQDARKIFRPLPAVADSIPDDVLTTVPEKARRALAEILREQGFHITVEKNNVPIITRTHANLLSPETLENFNITLDQIVSSTALAVQSASTKPKRVGRKTGAAAMRGIFALSGKSLDDKLKERLGEAGVEMVPGAEIVLDSLPKEMLDEFVQMLEYELRTIDAQELYERFEKMKEYEVQYLIEQLQGQGIRFPQGEDGPQLTKSFIGTLPRDPLINALERITYLALESRFQDEEAKKEAAMEESERLQQNEDETRAEDSKEILVDEDTSEIRTRTSHTGRDSFDDQNEVELILTDEQLDDFYDKLMEEGIKVPVDEATGKPRFTRSFLRRIPKNIAQEIVAAARLNNDPNAFLDPSPAESSSSSEEAVDTVKNGANADVATTLEESILGLQLRPNGLTYIVDNKGVRMPFEKALDFLLMKYSDTELKEHDKYNIEREASLRAAIREERRREEKNARMKKVPSEIEIQKMAMRYVPQYNPRPRKADPLSLFKREFPASIETAPSKVKVEFFKMQDPTTVHAVNSLETVPSSVDVRLSNISVVGSSKSTMLSDLPSVFSQNLPEDTSMVFTATNTQIFDATPESVSSYREKWLCAFMKGYTPMPTFVIRIINMITQRQIDLRITKENTLNELCHMYMQYEDHPERYVWKDIHGRLLLPDKTVVQNGLVGKEEVLEFQGYRRTPVILLYFRDGFENEPSLPLNPLHALRHREPGLCRNY